MVIHAYLHRSARRAALNYLLRIQVLNTQKKIINHF